MNRQSLRHRITQIIRYFSICFIVMSCIPQNQIITITPEKKWEAGETFHNFVLEGQAYTEKDAEAVLLFHTDGESGYEVLFKNGTMDGSRKTGSLSAIRNLYRSLANDNEWFNFKVCVHDKNITVQINGTNVVCYTEPSNPYRTTEYSKRLLGQGNIILKGKQGTVKFQNIRITPLTQGTYKANDTLPAIDEQNDAIIRLQQQNFPVHELRHQLWCRP